MTATPQPPKKQKFNFPHVMKDMVIFIDISPQNSSEQDPMCMVSEASQGWSLSQGYKRFKATIRVPVPLRDPEEEIDKVIEVEEVEE